MLAHQKNDAGNSSSTTTCCATTPEPNDFASFLYASQVLQAEGIKIGAEHLRRNRPRTMGSIFWQLNDCWPVASWSSIDYYGRWKALQYYARRFYAPLLVSPHGKNGMSSVYIVSDKLTARTAGEFICASWTSMANGKGLIDKPVTWRSFQARCICHALLDLGNCRRIRCRGRCCLPSCLWTARVFPRNLVLFVHTRDMAASGGEIHADWLELRRVNAAPATHLAVLARIVYVTFGDREARLSDNYFDLLPGEPVTLQLKSTVAIEQLRQSLRVRNITDAFPRDLASR